MLGRKKRSQRQLDAFMAKPQKRLEPIMDDGSVYSVKVYGHKELYMVFNRRQDARVYKSVLINSRAGLKSDIFYQKFEGGYQTEEKKIS